MKDYSDIGLYNWADVIAELWPGEIECPDCETVHKAALPCPTCGRMPDPDPDDEFTINDFRWAGGGP